MEESVALVAVLLCILIAAAISKRIQGTIITLPMIYTLLGQAFSGLSTNGTRYCRKLTPGNWVSRL